MKKLLRGLEHWTEESAYNVTKTKARAVSSQISDKRVQMLHKQGIAVILNHGGCCPLHRFLSVTVTGLPTDT